MTDDVQEPPTLTGSFGKYTLVSELGRGAMGVVFEAIDSELHRTVALKMLLSTVSLTAEDAAQDQERFLREARVCANLPKHPSIVGVHEAGVINGRRYIAMEYVRGRQMSAWTREAGVSLRRKLAVLRDTALAIEHAHRHRVIHRDLKPHNVLVDAEGRPHVMDFGLAKRMTETPGDLHLTIQGVVAGTPAYMSPEQAEGRGDVDHRTDIYALGVMLFEILADRVPFLGTSPFKVMVKVVQDPMPSPSALAAAKGLPAVDPALENICMKAVAKKAADRYAAAGELAADLSRWLEGQKVTVVPPRKPAKRSPTTVIGLAKPAPASRTGLVAALAAGAVLLAIVGFLLLRDPEAPPPHEDAAAQSDARRAQAKIVAQLLDEAEAQTAAGRHSAALVTYGKVLARDPQNPAALAGQRDAERRIESEKSTAAKAAADAEKAKPRDPEPARPPKPAEETRPAAPTLPAAAVEPASLAAGLVSDFFADRDLGRLAVSRLDPRIDFRWAGGPAWPGGPGQSFSARWRGYLRVPKTALYTLHVTSDDGARFFLDETSVVANWKEHRETTDSVPLILEEGLHALRVEYFQATAEGVIRLAWSEADGPAQAIPAEFLCHKAADFRPFPAPAAVAPPPPAASLSPVQRLGAMLAECREKLRGQAVTLVRPGMPETPATIKEVGAKEVALVLKVAGGGTAETTEFLETMSPALLLQLARRAWPAPAPEQLVTICSAVADRGDLECAWKEAERVKGPGLRETAAALLDRERARIEGLKTAAERSAAWKKLLAARAGLLDEDQKKGIAAETAAADQPARPAGPLKLVERPPLAGHEGEIRGVAFSPDGKTLASAGFDTTIRLWDAATGQPRGTLKQGSPVWRVAFSPDGKTLAGSDSGGKVKLWDLSTGAERLTYSGHIHQVVGIAFSPDGQCVASASTDNTARVWETATGRERAVLRDHPKGALDAVFSPDGRILAVATADHQVHLWDWTKSEVKGILAGHSAGILTLSFTPDGRTLLSASKDGTLKLWEVASGKERLTLTPSTPEVAGGAISPDGRVVASLGKDGMLKLWELQTGRELLSLKAHADYGRHVAFSPNGRMVATAGGTPSLRLFDLPKP